MRDNLGIPTNNLSAFCVAFPRKALGLIIVFPFQIICSMPETSLYCCWTLDFCEISTSNPSKELTLLVLIIVLKT